MVAEMDCLNSRSLSRFRRVTNNGICILIKTVHTGTPREHKKSLKLLKVSNFSFSFEKGTVFSLLFRQKQIAHQRNDVAVEYLALLLCIREVPRSNFCPEARYPDWGFPWFSLLPRDKCRDSTSN
jgi:hypothetical protein